MTASTRPGTLPSRTIIGMNWQCPLVVCGVVLALVALSARAAHGETDDGAPPEGWVPLDVAGSILALAIDPATSSTLYAGTDGGGVFRSADGGVTWAAANTGLANEVILTLAVNPATPTTLYAGTGGGGVFRSLDGGITWTSTGLSNGIVRSLAIDPATPATLYAGTTGVLRSVDGAATWAPTSLTSWSIHALAVDPAMPTTLYAGAIGGVLRSLDGGATWAAVNTGLPSQLPGRWVRALAIDPTTPTTLYAGADGGVFRSLDGGTTWAAMNTGLPSLPVRALAMDPANPTTLYAGTDGAGVFRSLDGGMTWAAMSTGLSSLAIRTLVIDPAATLYAGTDGEGLFRWQPGTPASSPPVVGAIVPSVGVPGTMVSATLIGAHLGDASQVAFSGTGVTATIGAGGTATVLPITIAIDENAAPGMRTIIVTTPDGTSAPFSGFFVTDPLPPLPPPPTIDGIAPATGEAGTWIPAVLTGTNLSGATAVTFSGTGVTAVVRIGTDTSLPINIAMAADAAPGERTVTVTTAGGTSAPFAGFTVTPAVSVPPVITAIAPAGGAAGTAFAAVLTGTQLVGATAVTVSGGGVAAVIRPGGTPTSVPITLIIDPAAASGVRDVTVTTPAGTSAPLPGFTVVPLPEAPVGHWVPQQPAVLTVGIRALAIDPLTPTTLYAGTHAGVQKSLDGGVTWAFMDISLANVLSLAVDPATRATLYAGTQSGGVYRSADGGVTWVATNVGLTNLTVMALAIDPAAPTTLYAGTVDGIFRSESGGATWTAINAGLTYRIVRALAIDPTTPTTLYAGTSLGVFRSTNGGATWAEVVNSGVTHTNVSTLAIDPETPATLYAGTSHGMFRSADGGATWTAMNVGLTNSIIQAVAIDGAVPTRIYAGTSGGVFWSVDGGATWAAMNAGLTSLSVQALALTQATLYAGTAVGVFRWQLGVPLPPLPPAITGITPASMAAGTTASVLITGTGLAGATAVTVSGTGVIATIEEGGTATSLPITMTIAVDALFGGRTLAVTTPLGTSTPFTGFTVTTAAPALTGISPPVGVRGVSTEVVLTGSQFIPGSTAILAGPGIIPSGVSATSPESLTATFIIAADAALGTRNIAVMTSGGMSNGVPFTVADPYADLRVTSTHAGDFAVGFDDTYAVAVENVGSAATTGPTTVVSTLPAGLAFVSATGSGWACGVAGPLVTCVHAAPLAVSASTSVTITVATDTATGGVFDHVVSVATAGDLNTSNDTVSDSITIVAVPVPVFTFAPLPLVAGQQAAVSVTLTSPYPQDLTGTLTLGFVPGAGITTDDAAIQFETGGRQVAFTIAAGTLEPRFAGRPVAGPLGFQAGTLAGTLTFSGALESGRVATAFAPTVALDGLTIPVQPPTVHAITTTPAPGGFAAQVLLSSPMLEVTQVSLQFVTTPAVQLGCGTTPGCAVSGSTITLDVWPLFSAWFSSGAATGSLSTLRLPLSIHGSVQGTVQVRLHNSRGVSSPMAFPLP